jgi:tRNA(Ile)-lysidine synthase
MLPLERRFAAVIKTLGIKEDFPLAIACSGGGDSMALSLLAKSALVGRKGRIVALTVDHGLRRESAKEARQVGAWLKKQGIVQVILPWKGKKPKRNIQEAARNARYKLMADYCAKHGIAHLLVAHHLEDQAETFLLRLARGSGVDGLSAMAALTPMHGLTLVRPLLAIPKAELLAYLKKRRQPYAHDPSNENEAFDRVKMRKLLPQLQAAGLSAERLAKTAATMARARAHLEEETGRFLNRACVIHAEGYAVLKHLSISEEIALRALSTLIMLVGGNEVKVRLRDLERLHGALKSPGFKGATLGGCVFAPHKATVLIYRELKGLAPSRAVKPGAPVMWDNRFEVTLASPNKGLRVGALTQGGWLKLAKASGVKNPCPSKNILYSLPALRDFRGRILAVPHLNYCVQGMSCVITFKSNA